MSIGRRFSERIGLPYDKPGVHTRPVTPLPLFADAPQVVNGFRYQGDVIDASEEVRLLALFAALPFERLDAQGVQANREILAFGSGYDFTPRQVRQAGPIPEWLAGLQAKAGTFASPPHGNLR